MKNHTQTAFNTVDASASFFLLTDMADCVQDTCPARSVIHNPIKHEAVCSLVLFRFISVTTAQIHLGAMMWDVEPLFCNVCSVTFYTLFLSAAVGGHGGALSPVSTPRLDERLHELSKCSSSKCNNPDGFWMRLCSGYATEKGIYRAALTTAIPRR